MKKLALCGAALLALSLGACQTTLQSDLTAVNAALQTGAALAPSICTDIAVAGSLVDAAATAASVSGSSPVKARTVTNVSNASAEANSACATLSAATATAAANAAQ